MATRRWVRNWKWVEVYGRNLPTNHFLLECCVPQHAQRHAYWIEVSKHSETCIKRFYKQAGYLRCDIFPAFVWGWIGLWTLGTYRTRSLCIARPNTSDSGGVQLGPRGIGDSIPFLCSSTSWTADEDPKRYLILEKWSAGTFYIFNLVHTQIGGVQPGPQGTSDSIRFSYSSISRTADGDPKHYLLLEKWNAGPFHIFKFVHTQFPADRKPIAETVSEVYAVLGSFTIWLICFIASFLRIEARRPSFSPFIALRNEQLI